MLAPGRSSSISSLVPIATVPIWLNIFLSHCPNKLTSMAVVVAVPSTPAANLNSRFRWKMRKCKIKWKTLGWTKIMFISIIFWHLEQKQNFLETNKKAFCHPIRNYWVDHSLTYYVYAALFIFLHFDFIGFKLCIHSFSAWWSCSFFTIAFHYYL